jgi:hypothetical protein
LFVLFGSAAFEQLNTLVTGMVLTKNKMTMTTIESIDDIPLLEGEALDDFLGQYRNDKGRIVKYYHTNYTKRTAKKIIADMEEDIAMLKAKLPKVKNRIEKNSLYRRIEGKQRNIKYAETFLTS